MRVFSKRNLCAGQAFIGKAHYELPPIIAIRGEIARRLVRWRRRPAMQHARLIFMARADTLP